MNKTVHNCIDCPMGIPSKLKYSYHYSCSISDGQTVVYHDSELEEIDYPLPIACPLRTEPITISLI